LTFNVEVEQPDPGVGVQPLKKKNQSGSVVSTMVKDNKTSSFYVRIRRWQTLSKEGSESGWPIKIGDVSGSGSLVGNVVIE
jgi:hypothetical protein